MEKLSYNIHYSEKEEVKGNLALLPPMLRDLLSEEVSKYVQIEAESAEEAVDKLKKKVGKDKLNSIVSVDIIN